MDAVADKIDDLGMTREEVLHRIAWRMSIDTRILKGARDDALIAVGDVLLGTFSWTNREDVACNRLARISADAPEEQLRLWRALLNSYNYLAACKYRNLQRPADPAFEHELKTAIGAFESSIENQLLGNSDTLSGSASGGYCRTSPRRKLNVSRHLIDCCSEIIEEWCWRSKPHSPIIMRW